MSSRITEETGSAGAEATSRGVVPGWVVALLVGLLLGLVPGVWSKRLAPPVKKRLSTPQVAAAKRPSAPKQKRLRSHALASADGVPCRTATREVRP